jgi:hypothetical protein
MEIITRKQAREQGLKTYFTGKPCKHGNFAPRCVADPRCTCLDCTTKRRNRESPEQKSARSRRYYQENKQALIDAAVAYKRNRLETDAAYRAEHNLRRRLHVVVKAQGTAKAYRFNQLVGCTAPELKAHIEKQFQEGMSWDNYGEWEVDHIRPCASFDLRDSEQQKACFCYTNLQPLWREENAKKKARWAA